MVQGQVHFSDVVLIFAAVIVVNWLFNNARGSVLIVMVLHTANNAISGSFFSPMFRSRLSAAVVAAGPGLVRHGDLDHCYLRPNTLVA